MYIIFTDPNQFAVSLHEASEIADDWYQRTGEIVAVQLSQQHPQLQGG